MRSKNQKIVVIGGGTGTFVVLSGLKKHPVDLTAVVSMADSGGSNRVIRDEFGLLPTSDIRQCMVALAETNGESRLLRELFTYRFHQTKRMEGMTFGNLFMAALADIMGSQEKAIEETGKILRIKGQILPVTNDDVDLVARYQNGLKVVGEHEIDEPEHDGKLRIERLSTEPEARVDKHADQAIRSADLLVLGPGDLYTSVLANLAVKGVPEAMNQSRGKLVYIVNLMTRWGQTYNFSAADHVAQVEKYLGPGSVDAVIANSNLDFPKSVLRAYEKEHAEPVKLDLEGNGYRVYKQDLLSSRLHKRQKADKLTRSLVRHDPEKLGNAILKVFESGE